MTIRQLTGDCRVTLPTLEADSVQAVITSPPFYGLRDYGTPPLVWGGDAKHGHAFGPLSSVPDVGRRDTSRRVTGHGSFDPVASDPHVAAAAGAFCACGAWLGSLGLEPTPELYVLDIVECFHHVRRVLRDDGTLWVNLGDSYNNRKVSRPSSHQGGLGFHNESIDTSWAEHTRNGRIRMSLSSGGLKEKDLLMMPARVAMALQEDGWYLRSMIPWLKRNSMPESVTDRPSTAVEYVFLLAKSARYFWDADAVRTPHHDAAGPPSRFGNIGVNGGYRGSTSPDGLARGDFAHRPGGREYNPSGRSRRNADWFFESWQGLLLDEQDDPLALVVNPQPFKSAHYATFPVKLVEPMVKASTSERGCCPECRTPWERVTETTYVKSPVHGPGSQMRKRSETTEINGWAGMPRVARQDTTTGWRPTCAHTSEPVPCTVLDPFGGAGTVGLVADRLGRNAVLCELKDDYAGMSADRITGDAPLFVELEP